jgi:hypothetical protein
MMKKTLAVLVLAALCGLCYAQAENPFATATGERWQGRIAYTDASNARHSDLYEIIFVPNGTCIVTVQTKENGQDLFQDWDGLKIAHAEAQRRGASTGSAAETTGA